MNIEEIHFKLKPMVKDLEWTNFKNYLASNDFDRLCINVGYGELWDSLKNTLRKYYESNGAYNRTSYISFEIFFNLLNSYYGTCQTSWNPLTVKDSEFSNFLFAAFNGYFLSDYEVSEKFAKILEDLQHLPIPISQKKQLQEQFSINLKILKENQAKRKTEEEQKVKEREQRKLAKTDVIKKTPIEDVSKALNSKQKQKQNWLKLISKAEVQKVVDELIEFGIENDLNQFLILSNRWHSMQKDFHKGIMKRDDFELENNKIVDALFNFIKNIEDTEESL